MSKRDEQITIIGAGRSGLAAARLACRLGARVVVADARALPRPPAAELPAACEFRAGEQEQALAAARGLIVISPGVPTALPELEAARRRGAAVIGELEFAWRNLGKTLRGVIGITGSDGKSTTTKLAGEFFQAAGFKVFVGGNIGNPLANLPVREPESEYAVIELSSFQLETIETFQPTVAALLNLAPDHLDRYRSVDDYYRAKRRLFEVLRPEAIAVINAADPLVLKWTAGTAAAVWSFGAAGAGAVRALPAANHGFVIRGLSAGDEEYQITSPDLAGGFNRENAMAAALASRAAGVPPAAIGEGLRTFRGLLHRGSLAAEHGGVRWVDNSKATNCHSAAAAIRSAGAGVLLIAGGMAKETDFSALVEACRGRLAAALLIGRDAELLGRALAEAGPVEQCGGLEQAVRRALALARPGDTVLLAPACASFDQYQDYNRRGEHFTELVRRLTGGGA